MTFPASIAGNPQYSVTASYVFTIPALGVANNSWY